MRAPERELVSPAAYARRRGVSRQAVAKAIKDGRIVLLEGKIDPAVADVQWEVNSQPRPGRAKGSRDAAGGESWAVARNRRESAAADLAELELAERRGELVRVADVERKLVELVTSLRDRLVSIGDRLGPLVSAAPDPATATRMIDAEVRTVLNDFAAALKAGRPADATE